MKKAIVLFIPFILCSCVVNESTSSVSNREEILQEYENRFNSFYNSTNYTIEYTITYTNVSNFGAPMLIERDDYVMRVVQGSITENYQLRKDYEIFYVGNPETHELSMHVYNWHEETWSHSNIDSTYFDNYFALPSNISIVNFSDATLQGNKVMTADLEINIGEDSVMRIQNMVYTFNENDIEFSFDSVIENYNDKSTSIVSYILSLKKVGTTFVETPIFDLDKTELKQ